MSEHRILPDKGNYSFLCETCPLNGLEPYEAAASAAKVDQAEEDKRGIGKATTEIGIMVNACRLARRQDGCAEPEALQGMAAEMWDVDRETYTIAFESIASRHQDA